MDALEYIVENMDFLKLLEHYNFDVDNVNGNMLRSRCAIHGGNNPTSFVANLDNGLWFCHTGCQEGGDVVRLVERIEKLNFKDALNFCANFFGLDISNMDIVASEDKRKKELKEWIRYATRKKTQPLIEYIPNVLMRDINKLRNFQKETLNYFGVKFIPLIELERRDKSIYTLQNRIYIPIIFNGVQVGFILRKTKGSDFPKWSNQPSNFDFGNILYNYDNIKQSLCQEITVVEGLFDVMAYHEIGIPAVATFGAHMTKQQERLLLSTFADITLSYDNDKAGSKATQKIIKSMNNKTTIKVVPLKDGADPESITRGELLKSYNNRRAKLC